MARFLPGVRPCVARFGCLTVPTSLAVQRNVVRPKSESGPLTPLDNPLREPATSPPQLPLFSQNQRRLEVTDSSDAVPQDRSGFQLALWTAHWLARRAAFPGICSARHRFHNVIRQRDA